MLRGKMKWIDRERKREILKCREKIQKRQGDIEKKGGRKRGR